MDLLGTPAPHLAVLYLTASEFPSSDVPTPHIPVTELAASTAHASVPPAAVPSGAAGRGTLARWTHRLRVALLDTTVRVPGARVAAGADGGDLAGALDDLAHRVADVEHAWAARAVLAELVRRLEHLTGVPRSEPAPDPVVVLQRRFDHAHRLLLEDPRGLTAADVRALHLGFAGPA